MNLIEHCVHRGPNLYCQQSVVRFSITPGQLNLPSTQVNSHGLDLSGEIQKHLAEFHAPPDILFPELLGRLCIHLQRQCGEHVEFLQVLREPDSDLQHILIGYRTGDIALAAWNLSWMLCMSIVIDRFSGRNESGIDEKFPTLYEEFISDVRRRILCYHSQIIIDTAEKLGIPWYRLTKHKDYLLLGQGCRQQLLNITSTSHSSQIAASLTHDKAAMHNRLANLGIPVPRYRLVSDRQQAGGYAEQIGYPVVLKPLYGRQGNGVHPGIRNAQELQAALDATEDQGQLMIESMLPGGDYRLLVINDQLVAAARRMPAFLIGDGHHSAEELLQQYNQHPSLRIIDKGKTRKLALADFLEVLQEQGFEADSIPANGQYIQLGKTANASKGGIPMDVLDNVHPDNRQLALDIARIVDLGIIGIDFITPSISQSWKRVGGGICEVNYGPGLKVHTGAGIPAETLIRPMLQMLYPAAGSWNIPSAAISGSNGKTTSARMLAAIMQEHGYCVGLTCTEGSYIDNEQVFSGDHSGGGHAIRLMQNPKVEMGIHELARGGVALKGTQLERVDVAAITNVTQDHVGTRKTPDFATLLALKSLVAQLADQALVLNADDPNCLNMRASSNAREIILISLHPDNPAIRQHAGNGGRCLIVDSSKTNCPMHLLQHDRAIHYMDLDQIPATFGGLATHNVQNACLAAAMAVSFGVEAQVIHDGLAGFGSSMEHSAGRLNFYPDLPFDLIVDFAHNPEAVAALYSFIEKLPVQGQRTAILFSPGDRPMEQAMQVGTTAAGQFDHYIVRGANHERTHSPEQVMQWVKQGLLSANVADNHITTIPDRLAALTYAMENANDGDLIVICSSDYEIIWQHIGREAERLQLKQAAASCSTD